MINYFNFKRLNNEYLLTNDFGKYIFLDVDDFRGLIMNGTVKNTEIQNELIDNKFIYTSSMDKFIEDNLPLMRKSKEYLFQSTQLHIFVVTNVCNMQCIYCQAQNGKVRQSGFMTKDVAKRAVDIALQSPSEHLQFEFQGGEPLLNFDVIKYIVEYTKNIANGKHIEFSIVSNLTLLTNEILEFIKENNISISTSLDGDSVLHNLNRPFINGNGTYEEVFSAIDRVRTSGLHIGALQTTTKNSLARYKEIIDIYIELGFDSVSLRPLTPLGCANKDWEKIGYSADEFIEFYKNALDYIIEKNENIYLRENISSIFLKKILCGTGVNYMELRSPCGAAIGQIAYYYNGNIYTCDEGRMISEMGDQSFCLGNVFKSSYDSIIDNDVCKTVSLCSTLEALPSCSDCVYQPYCGVCPVINYTLDSDIYERRPNNYRCLINKGMLDILFAKLQCKDEKVTNTFWRWVK